MKPRTVKNLEQSRTFPGSYLALAAALLATSGCGTLPTASVSAPTEYNALHLQAAQTRIASDFKQSGVLSNLHRYFASHAEGYESNKLRMDVMLDEAQVATARRQSLTLDFLLKAMALQSGESRTNTTEGKDEKSEGSGADKSEQANSSPGDKASAEEPKGESDARPKTWDSATQDALVKVIESSVVDSPFDRLDRVSDFYAAYMLKHLRLQGDSRALSTPLLEQWYLRTLPEVIRTNLAAVEAAVKQRPPSHRLLLLGFQTQVTAGSKANYMTGVRVRLRDDRGHPVPVLRLHPSRTYDLDLTAVQDESTLSWKIEGAGKPHAAVTLEGRMGGRSKQESMKRFYARLGKVSSYVEAGAGEFGWDFYPSNLRLVQANVVQSFWGLFFGTVERQRTKGFLEAGGRDAFALVLVPWDAREIFYEIHTSAGPLSPDGAGLLWRHRHPHFNEGWSKPGTLKLSTPSPGEAVAATVPLWAGNHHSATPSANPKEGKGQARSDAGKTGAGFSPGGGVTPAGADHLLKTE